MTWCDCTTYCKGYTKETGECQGLPAPEALRGPQAVGGPRAIPDYPSRTFAGANGFRTVPWDDWVGMRQRALDLAETVERLLNDPVRKELAELKTRLGTGTSDAEMALRRIWQRHKNNLPIPADWWPGIERIAMRNASPLRQGADSPTGQTPEEADHVRRVDKAMESSAQCEPDPTPGVQSAPATPRLSAGRGFTTPDRQEP